jgi:hypothetical protein
MKSALYAAPSDRVYSIKNTIERLYPQEVILDVIVLMGWCHGTSQQ